MNLTQALSSTLLTLTTFTALSQPVQAVRLTSGSNPQSEPYLDTTGDGWADTVGLLKFEFAEALEPQGDYFTLFGDFEDFNLIDNSDLTVETFEIDVQDERTGLNTSPETITEVNPTNPLAASGNFVVDDVPFMGFDGGDLRIALNPTDTVTPTLPQGNVSLEVEYDVRDEDREAVPEPAGVLGLALVTGVFATYRRFQNRP